MPGFAKSVEASRRLPSFVKYDNVRSSLFTKCIFDTYELTSEISWRCRGCNVGAYLRYIAAGLCHVGNTHKKSRNDGFAG